MQEKVLARVGTLTVSEREVEEFIYGLGQRGQSYNTPEGRKIVLEQLIGNKLLLLDAKRNLYEAEPEFKAQLTRLKENLLTSYAGEKAVSGVTVSDAELKEYYESNKDKLTSAETVNASHILVDSEEKALEILSDIKTGKITFEDAAKKYSSCPSGQSGGSLGDFERGQMVPEFDTAVFEMAVGTITEAPVKTQFGYHLIKLNSKSEPGVLSFDAVKAELKPMLLNEKRRKAYESKINQLKIMYPVDILGI